MSDRAGSSLAYENLKLPQFVHTYVVVKNESKNWPNLIKDCSSKDALRFKQEVGNFKHED